MKHLIPIKTREMTIKIIKNLTRKNLFDFPSLNLLVSFLLLGFLNSSFAQSYQSPVGSFLEKNLKSGPVYSTSLSELAQGEVIKEVLVEGNKLIPIDEILGVMETNPGEAFDKERILKDLEAINNLGYFVRDSIQATPQKTDGGILLKIRIVENSPIQGVEIQGNELVNSDELTSFLNELIGKPECILKISEALDKIERQYQEKGFLLARVNNVEVNEDGILVVNINEGKINKIIFRGNTKTKEKFLRRLTPNLQEGEIYNEVLLVQDLRALKNTGYFEEINRQIEFSEEDPNEMNLVIDIKEKRSASFGFGGGVNTLSGAFGNLGFTNSNLFGEGKKLSLNTQVGTGLLSGAVDNERFLVNKKTIQAEARYTDPYFRGTNTTFSAYTNANTLASYQVDSAQEKSFSLGTSFSKPLGMNVSGSVDLLGEVTSLNEVSDSATSFLEKQLVNVENGKYLEELIQEKPSKPGQSFNEHTNDLKAENAEKIAKKIREEQLEGGKFLHLNPSLSYDTRDKDINPRSGWNNKLTVGQAVGIGNDSYTKLGIDLRKYIPIGEKSTIAFNLRGASAIVGDVPAYNQFRAGGFYGVRGYRPFSDLGIGSRSLLASAEYRTPILDLIPQLRNSTISKNVSLVVFNDFGYVGGNSRLNRLFNRLDTAASAGVGIRANLPFLGAVRVDYGIPLIKPLWDKGGILGRFNFGFADRF